MGSDNIWYDQCSEDSTFSALALAILFAASKKSQQVGKGSRCERRTLYVLVRAPKRTHVLEGA